MAIYEGHCMRTEMNGQKTKMYWQSKPYAVCDESMNPASVNTNQTKRNKKGDTY